MLRKRKSFTVLYSCWFQMIFVADEQTEHVACEGTKLTLACPKGSTLDINYANYGRRVSCIYFYHPSRIANHVCAVCTSKIRLLIERCVTPCYCRLPCILLFFLLQVTSQKVCPYKKDHNDDTNCLNEATSFDIVKEQCQGAESCKVMSYLRSITGGTVDCFSSTSSNVFNSISQEQN